MSTVLWIEDQIEEDLIDLLAEARAAGHVITYLPDATSAVATMNRKQFDYVVVDIRIAPGDDPSWRTYFEDMYGGNKEEARLGLEMLRWIWGKASKNLSFHQLTSPKWLTADRVGVLTVETWGEPDNLGKDLTDLGIPIKHYMRKSDPGEPSTRLCELINRLRSIGASGTQSPGV